MLDNTTMELMDSARVRGIFTIRVECPHSLLVNLRNLLWILDALLDLSLKQP